jgi:hypothetical protein
MGVCPTFRMRLVGAKSPPCSTFTIFTNLLTFYLFIKIGRGPQGKRTYKGNVGEVGRLTGANLLPLRGSALPLGHGIHLPRHPLRATQGHPVD